MNDHRIFLQDFLDAGRVSGLSSRTLSFYTQKLTPFCDWLDSQNLSSLFDVTPRHVRAYLSQFQENHNPGGVAASFRAVRAFLRWVSREYPDQHWNPLTNVKTPKVPDDVLPPVDMAHLRAILATCKGRRFTDVRDAAIIRSLTSTGMRASEFLALRVADIDQAGEEVYLRATSTKGKRPRTVFLDVESRKAMRRYLALRGGNPGDALWVRQTGEPLDYWGFYEMFRRRSKLAGVPNISPHAIRRTFAVEYLRNQGDLETLRHLLGHRNLTVLQRYLPLVNADLKQAHLQHGPRL